jgi:midasin
LFDSYRSCVRELLSTHADVVSIRDDTIEIASAAEISNHYRQQLKTLFLRIQKHQYTAHDDPAKASHAWIDLALAGLALYVPNYPYDPALRLMVERKMFTEQKSHLVQHLQTLQGFQLGFTGQNSSLRIRRTEQEIWEMGVEPPIPSIVRPDVSEVDALQGEFTNLLSSIKPLLDGTMTADEAVHDVTLRQNITLINSRLAHGYRSYDDITGPAVGFLTCLNIGLVLGSLVNPEGGKVQRSLQYITHHTPFFGLSDRYNRAGSAILYESCEQELDKEDHAVDLRWHALQSLKIVQTLDPSQFKLQRVRTLLLNIFTSLYSEWKIKLLKDQEKEAKDSSLYTYKGDDQEGDEEDPELFPDYENESGPNDLSPATSRDHAIRVAEMHADLLLGGTSTSKALEGLLEYSATELVRVAGGMANNTRHENSLPAIFLALGKRLDSLAASRDSKLYNFYFDANLIEAKKFVQLVHRIRQRYRTIHEALEIDHATVLDVLRSCDEALAFRHVDPVAKFITKAEKLHEYMHAWQPLAKRDLRAPELFDELTGLLVSWRQLELTTWARLFNVEVEKCRKDAKSWFFVAFETIIVASESIKDMETMKDHAKALLKILESFFFTTNLGQFEQRLKLLEQLREHIGMLNAGTGAFEPVYRALGHFVDLFSRYERQVQEHLTKGRQALEKDIHDVIKLASWKDTTIQALKQSAKTSHRKLTKLVRKFRALLNQPLSGILNAGILEQNFTVMPPLMESGYITRTPLLAQHCEDHVPGWTERPTRFKNLTTTVALMRNLTLPGTECVDGAIYIESFITDLDTTIVQLQKATPAILTEENKEDVQHLKTRKRKLYADTMKELRQMGVVSNLGSDILAKQDELSIVLANLPSKPVQDSPNGEGSEYYLHKSLNIMNQVRNVYKEHSGDLTSNDVSRSIGYLEGLLHAVIKQRGQLSRAKDNLQHLQIPTSQVDNLCSLEHMTISTVSGGQVAELISLQTGVSWLSAVLETAAKLVAIQADLGKTNELTTVVDGLRDWSDQFKKLTQNDFKHLPVLPENLWSETHVGVAQTSIEKLAEFRHLFNVWFENHPATRVVLKQIKPYVLDIPRAGAAQLPVSERVRLDDFCNEVFGSLDLILGAMQDVSSSLKGIPASPEDAMWLVKEEQAIFAAFSALHTTTVTKAVNNIVDNMHCLGEGSDLQAAIALISAIHPILHQYRSSHEFLVSKLEVLHLSTTKLLYRLARSFIQVGSQGFCTPSEKSSDQQQGKDEKLESGTGLGSGEGADDISKDIEDDEDLDDLAQEKDDKREGSIEHEDDAVDMGDKEMDGETGETAEKEEEDGEGEEGEDDVESQVGSVDEHGPSAVDEKMWDEGGKEDDESKEKEGPQDVGTSNQDEQVASDEQKKDEGEEPEKGDGEKEDEDMEMEGEEQDENIGTGEPEKMDPHAKEEETLDLPDELDLDGNEDVKDDDLGDMDMGEEDDEIMDDDGAEPDTVNDEVGPEQVNEDDQTVEEHVKDEESLTDEEKEEEDEGPVDDDVIPLPDESAPEDDGREDRDQIADTNAEAGAGADANEEAHQDQKAQASATAANQQEGNEGETMEDKQETNAEDGNLGQTAQPDASRRGEDEQATANTESFKKLGDVLEKWYNQQRQISESKQKDETQVQQIDKEVDMADADFEHLPDDETQADAQALGTATEEQAKALDHDMAMTVDEQDEETVPVRPEDRDEPDQNDGQDAEMNDAAPEQDREQQQIADGRPQAFVGEQMPLDPDKDEAMEDARPLEDEFSETSSVQEVETQLELTHLDPAFSAMSPENARALWLHHESSTHSLSQQLTEHLRLILAPTLATKLRGDFRTGKRLNLKRIIPYIASGYKRDKIWLRRSMPSKRSYQVMIALDDSRSMAESGAANLALKTLTLVTRSLSMLEVGEVSVVSFGESVNVAHDFDKPFNSESGVRVFEQFGFEAGKTDVRRLVDKSLGLFAEARRKGASSAGEDLWQLMLVVSDGICDSHAEIQRLVRKAQEERVMIVFIIIDATATVSISDTKVPLATDAQGGSRMEKVKEKTSILDLQSVEISPEGKVVRWKYMERFPFRYYLVVRDVRELPGVLAGALRQWFGEVAGSSG